jgi:hypothetical protein
MILSFVGIVKSCVRGAHPELRSGPDTATRLIGDSSEQYAYKDVVYADADKSTYESRVMW